MNIIAPSILSADFGNLGNDIRIVAEAGAEYIHVDVMDGVFVPNISLGIPVVKSIRKCTDKVFDVHLMITEPIRYVKDFADAGADIITIHVEACKDVEATIEKIRECNVKAAIAINPETPVENVLPYLDKVDMVLVMSVHPGFGGQKFIPDVLDKIPAIKEKLNQLNRQIDIEIDGGINLDNVKTVTDAGVNVIVAGSSIYKGDAAANTKAFVNAVS